MKIWNLSEISLLLFSFLFFPDFSIRAESSYLKLDSISEDSNITNLDEFIVEGRTQRVIKNGVEYIPGKKIKNTSFDALSLLRNLRIPTLSITPSGESVKTLAGENINFFINYRQASSEQLQSLRVNDVIRVDILDYPEDPRFMGVQHAVNYIVKEYEWGGFTNLRIDGGTFLNDKGRFAIYSQFSYKRMRYYFYGGAGIEHSNNNYTYGNNIYRNIYFNSETKPSIDQSNTMPTRSLYQKNNEWIGTNIVYFHKGIYIEHTLEFAREATPADRYSFRSQTIPEIIAPSTACNSVSSSSMRPQIHAYYFFPLKHNNSLDFHWQFGTAVNKRQSEYLNQGLPAIFNNNHERTYEFEASTSYTQPLNSNSRLMVQFVTFNNNYDIDYAGSYIGKQNLFKSENMLFLKYFLNIGRKFTFQATPGVSEVYYCINSSSKSSQWNPRIFVRSSYTPAENQNISLAIAWGNNTPSPAFSTDAFLRQDYFLWIKGNPNLKNMNMSSASLNYSFIPSNKFSIAALFKYDGFHKVRVNRYFSTPEKDGVISESINSGTFYTLSGKINATAKLLNESLIFSAGIDYNFFHYSGIYKSHLSDFIANASASYFIGNFSATLYYKTPSRYISVADMATYREGDSYGIDLTYGYRNFKLNLSFNNWFNKRQAISSEFNSPNYSFRTWQVSPYGLGRFLRLTASFTISYGKRQQIYVDESIPSVGSSAILK